MSSTAITPWLDMIVDSQNSLTNDGNPYTSKHNAYPPLPNLIYCSLFSNRFPCVWMAASSSGS